MLELFPEIAKFKKSHKERGQGGGETKLIITVDGFDRRLNCTDSSYGHR